MLIENLHDAHCRCNISAYTRPRNVGSMPAEQKRQTRTNANASRAAWIAASTPAYLRYVTCTTDEGPIFIFISFVRIRAPSFVWRALFFFFRPPVPAIVRLQIFAVAKIYNFLLTFSVAALERTGMGSLCLRRRNERKTRERNGKRYIFSFRPYSHLTFLSLFSSFSAGRGIFFAAAHSQKV